MFMIIYTFRVNQNVSNVQELKDIKYYRIAYLKNHRGGNWDEKYTDGI